MNDTVIGYVTYMPIIKSLECLEIFLKNVLNIFKQLNLKTKKMTLLGFELETFDL